MSDTLTLSFPPLFSGEALGGQIDPFARACSQALLGCDAGLVCYNIGASELRAAVVFAPEVPLQKAMTVLVACGIGFQNALGALAPPEVAVHLTWQGGLEINGARCGRLRVAASDTDAKAVPDWIVIGLELPLIPPSGAVPGDTPDQTSLFEEGCADVDPGLLIEAWIRHLLPWVNRMEEDGAKGLHAEWQGLGKYVGEDVKFTLLNQDYSGTFMGVDEDFGMLLRTADGTDLLPLTLLLENGDDA